MDYDPSDPLHFALMHGEGPALSAEQEAFNKALECPEGHFTPSNRKARRAKNQGKKVLRVERTSYSKDSAYKGERRVI